MASIRPSWVGEPFRKLYEQLGADLDQPGRRTRRQRFWERIERIPDEQLWEAHQRQKLELAFFSRRRLQSQFARPGEAPRVLEEPVERARPGRADHRLCPPLRDVQARRADFHRRGAPGAAHLQRATGRSRSCSPARRIRPTGPARASSRTSSRAAARRASPAASSSGGLRHPHRALSRAGRRHLAQQPAPPARSLRYQWHEGGHERHRQLLGARWLVGRGLRRQNGWAIGDRDINPDEGAQDWADAQDLYRLLENEIVPMYYERDEEGLPRRWLDYMKRIRWPAPSGSSRRRRMLQEYVEQLYLPAAPEPAAPALEPAPAR